MHPFTIGIIASRNKVEYEYFTSAQFPILVEEALSVGNPVPGNGVLWGLPVEQLSVPLPQPISIALQATIVYQTYNNPLWTETVSVNLPQPISIALQATIVYQTYNNPLWTETVSVGVPSVQGASLQTVISYVSYNNSTAVESLSVGVPQLISGSLT